MSDTQKHTKPNVPNLRFPVFEGEWEQHLLSEYLEFKNGLNPSAKSFGEGIEGIKFISVMDILNNPYITYDCIRASVNATEKEKQEFYVEYGDILFQRSSETLEDVGHANVYLDRKPALFGGFTIRGKKKGDYNPLFFKYLLDSPKARKKVIVKGAGAQHFNIGQEGLSSVSLFFPAMQEQNKIAVLLELLDQRIAIQNKVIEDLITLEKEIVNYVFKTLNTVSVPLSNIAERVTTRNTNTLCDNVLTISARDGLISQLDFFNKSVASQNLSNYILLKRGDFAYNKSYSADHPWGAIKHLEIYDEGVLSPLYFCFRPIKGHIDTDYLQLYFETDLWHKHISDISVEGARNHGLLNMSVGDFMALPVPVPELNIQHDIARSLKSLRNKKSNEMKYREFLLRQKTYLLSHLFL
jgi:type I restriction enzyme S subunit